MCVRSVGRCNGLLSGGGVVYADAIALWCRSAGITPSRVRWREGLFPGWSLLVGYSQKMQGDVARLMELFRSHVPDRASNEQVARFVADPGAWPRGHDLFRDIRARNLEAIRRADRVAEAQFCFEEVCVQSLFNETDTDVPFDSTSPYWIIPNALALAVALGLPNEEVLAVVR